MVNGSCRDRALAAMIDARLTDDEIRKLLPVELRNFTVAGVGYAPTNRDVADAQLRKALWWTTNWIFQIGVAPNEKMLGAILSEKLRAFGIEPWQSSTAEAE